MTATNEKLWTTIRDLDLSSVKAKLTSKKGIWWNLRKDVDKIEKEYKQFLYLIATNPTETIVPWTQDLDDLWHEHILDTQKYTDDCNTIFGKYIHHNPNLPKGTSKHTTAYNNTKKLYKEAFKDKADKQKRGDSSSFCGAGCGGGHTTIMPVVFCGSVSSCGSHSSGGSSCSSGSSGGSSCGSASCGGGSSCGGGGCGGGGCSS